MQKAKHRYCMLIPKINVMIVKTLFMNSGKTGGLSATTKPPSQSSTVKPSSGSGNLHAESKTEILHADT